MFASLDGSLFVCAVWFLRVLFICLVACLFHVLHVILCATCCLFVCVVCVASCRVLCCFVSSCVALLPVELAVCLH